MNRIGQKHYSSATIIQWISNLIIIAAQVSVVAKPGLGDNIVTKTHCQLLIISSKYRKGYIIILAMMIKENAKYIHQGKKPWHTYAKFMFSVDHLLCLCYLFLTLMKGEIKVTKFWNAQMSLRICPNFLISFTGNFRKNIMPT